MRFARSHNRSAFMLIEALIASIILAVAATSIVSLLLSTEEQQQSIQEICTATMLAKQLMEEIAAKPLGVYPPASTSGGRSQFATVNQYDRYTDCTTTNGGIQTIGGQTVPLSNVGTYIRLVTITDAATEQVDPHDIRIVTVTVTTPSLKTVSMSKWLTNVALSQS